MNKLSLFAALCLPVSLYGQHVPGNNASTFSLVITEIMADPEPPVGMPEKEFCELLNRSSDTINLAGWIFYDGSSKVLPSVNVAPGSYVIICDDADTALFSGYGVCAPVSSISLTNSGEKISIRDAFGTAIDSVTYSDAWFGNSFKKDGGWSLEKVDVDFTCPVSANWMPSESGSGGTPGNVNSVMGNIADTDPPVLLRSFVRDSANIVLVFNEPLDPDMALELQQFSFSNSLIPLAAVFDDATLLRVRLTLNSVLSPGKIYVATVNNIPDCSGNSIDAGSTARFGLSDSSAGKLIINEILFNPYSGNYDFVELFHAGSGIIDLNQVNIESIDLESGLVDESGKIAEENWLLFPGDYLVLTESSLSVAHQYRSSYPFNFLETGNLPAMNVDEGHITISRQLSVLDAFHYYEDYHFELLEDYKGISLEKINPFFSSANPDSWHSAAASSGFATPGLKNSQFTELNPEKYEVTIEPEIFSPDNDGYNDYLTIILKPGTPGYISNFRIYNSSGQVIYENVENNLLATRDLFVWDGITAEGIRANPGIYIALVEVFNLEGNVKKHKLPFVLAVKL
ncbi:MAG: lamin tail domain-containing protein [Bacteroidota bacterium]|nr:lamin tail domain-containing protein [Bacteroidota bacterium]